MKDLTDKQIEKIFNDPKMLLWEHCNSVWFSGVGLDEFKGF